MTATTKPITTPMVALVKTNLVSKKHYVLLLNLLAGPLQGIHLTQKMLHLCENLPLLLLTPKMRDI